MERLDEINNGIKIRKDRLERLKNINAPDLLIQNELTMINQLKKEQREEKMKKRKEKLKIIDKFNKNE